MELLERLLQISPKTFVLLDHRLWHGGERRRGVPARGARLPDEADPARRGAGQDSPAAGLSRSCSWKTSGCGASSTASTTGRVHRRPISPAMQRVFEMVRKVAPTRSTVLLTGESGTGKELIARAIHRQGSGDDRRVSWPSTAPPSRTICWRTSSSAIARAPSPGPTATRRASSCMPGDGTVFLDEIGELPLATQAKLLRAIEQKEILPVGANEPVRVEARVLAATNKDLEQRSRGRPVPRGPVLSAQRGLDPPAAVARTARGHSRPGRFPAGPARPRPGQAHQRRDARGDAAAAGLPLEGATCASWTTPCSGRSSWARGR